MKALVPLNNMLHVDDYIASGAGEFYIGFYDESWQKAFGEYGDLNRLTGFKKDANPHNLEEVLEIIKKVKEKGKIIYVTFNSSIYSMAQMTYIRKYFEALKLVHVDGVIVSTIELVKLAREVGVPSVISTIAGVYNEDLARFFAEAGTKRIILPRDLSIDEIERIVQAVPEVEYEVFMMRNGCHFSDSNCLGLHRQEICSICSSVRHANNSIHILDSHDNLQGDFKAKHEVELNDMLYNTAFHSYACGLCAIYRFVKLGIKAGKIVGRSDEWQNICHDISVVKDNVELAKTCQSEEAYLKQMRFPQDEVVMCKLGLSCYYPEVRF